MCFFPVFDKTEVKQREISFLSITITTTLLNNKNGRNEKNRTCMHCFFVSIGFTYRYFYLWEIFSIDFSQVMSFCLALINFFLVYYWYQQVFCFGLFLRKRILYSKHFKFFFFQTTNDYLPVLVSNTFSFRWYLPGNDLFLVLILVVFGIIPSCFLPNLYQPIFLLKITPYRTYLNNNSRRTFFI